MSDVFKFIQRNFSKSIHINTEDKGTLLGLPYPYTVPSPDEMFQEMYYWDTYFTNVGLIAIGNVEQAKNNADNVRYMIDRYGFMPNGNRLHFLQFTQPPFYYKMVEDVFAVTQDMQWLQKSYEAIGKEYLFWMTKRIAPNGLNVYGAHPEHSKETAYSKYSYFATRWEGFSSEDEAVIDAAAHTIDALGESGWDCCSRFELAGRYYNPVDLNSLLYGLEMTMAKFSTLLKNADTSLWEKRAEDRKSKMDQYLFNPEMGIYMDWNYKDQKFSPVVSAASLYPLFTGLCTSQDGAIDILQNQLMLPYGVSCSVPAEYEYKLQWEYPNVWAPLQYVAYMACINTGNRELADTISNRYMQLLETNYAATGNLWEKYDGITGQVVNAEYNAPPMMGWTAGIYLFFYKNKHLNCVFPN